MQCRHSEGELWDQCLCLTGRIKTHPSVWRKKKKHVWVLQHFIFFLQEAARSLNAGLEEESCCRALHVGSLLRLFSRNRGHRLTGVTRETLKNRNGISLAGCLMCILPLFHPLSVCRICKNQWQSSQLGIQWLGSEGGGGGIQRDALTYHATDWLLHYHTNQVMLHKPLSARRGVFMQIIGTETFFGLLMNAWKGTEMLQTSQPLYFSNQDTPTAKQTSRRDGCAERTSCPVSHNNNNIKITVCVSQLQAAFDKITRTFYYLLE